jgi:CspA family cold shock protein
MNGLTKWFSDGKGFGFVQSGDKDYFIHFKEILVDGYKSLKEGDKVNFTPSQSPKGPVALQLKLGHE